MFIIIIISFSHPFPKIIKTIKRRKAEPQKERKNGEANMKLMKKICTFTKKPKKKKRGAIII